MVNADGHNDTKGELFQCNYTKYKHYWSAIHPVIIVDRNLLLYNSLLKCHNCQLFGYKCRDGAFAFCSLSTQGNIKPGYDNRENKRWL